MHIKYWLDRIEFNKTIMAVEINPIDIDLLLDYFTEFAKYLQIPAYYWNSGYDSLQKMETNEINKVRLSSAIEINRTTEPNYLLKFLLKSDQISSGIYLLDDLCNFEELDISVIREREALIANLERKYAFLNSSVYFVLLGEYFQFSNKLAARISKFKLPLPNRTEVETGVVKSSWLLKSDRE